MTINKFLINKGVKSNTEKITILQMVQWVDEWQEQEQLRLCGVGVTLPNKCEHKNIDRQDGCDECLDCGVRNY